VGHQQQQLADPWHGRPVGTTGRRPFTGTSSVKENCTGGATINFSDVIAVHLEFVMVAGETELIAIQTDPGAVLVGYAKKQ
jgi:hypothetical protein